MGAPEAEECLSRPYRARVLLRSVDPGRRSPGGSLALGWRVVAPQATPIPALANGGVCTAPSVPAHRRQAKDVRSTTETLSWRWLARLVRCPQPQRGETYRETVGAPTP